MKGGGGKWGLGSIYGGDNKIENYENHVENYIFSLVFSFLKSCYGFYRGNKEHQRWVRVEEISSDRVRNSMAKESCLKNCRKRQSPYEVPMLYKLSFLNYAV